MLESCMRPDLVVEITLQPVRRYGVDAAIFFSDIVTPLKFAGSTSRSSLASARWSADPIRDADGSRQRSARSPPADVPYITEAIQQLVVASSAVRR